MYGRAIFCLWVATFASAPASFCQIKASLETLQTTLQLEGEENAPHVVSLRSAHLPAWTNTVSEVLIPTAELESRNVPLTWKLNRHASHVDSKAASFVYEVASPHLRLIWEWKAAATSGPIEHTIRIENLSTQEIWIPLQESFRFRWSIGSDASLNHSYVDKGAGKPTAVGTHSAPIPVGFQWKGLSSTYAMDGDSREVIPWFMVQRNAEASDGWYVGVEFSGRTQLTLERDSSTVHGSVGLNPDPGPFRTRLLPGESFSTPTVFVGGFSGGPDGAGNILRPWVRQVLNNPKTWENPQYPMLVNNSWGSGMQVDEALSLRMIHDSAELGLELFHIDAGWFRGVGDWYPDPKKFPHGLAPIADEAHRNGLKFGIWVNWAEAGISTETGALDVNNPKTRDWLVADVPAGWKPEDFVGRTIDLGAPAVKDYAQREVLRIVNTYKLDMLEHDGYVVAKNCARDDHPHSARPSPQISTVKDRGLEMADSSNSTDVSYHATRAYYGIYSQLRSQHPNILLEICNDGGRMVDFGSASHGDYFSITDTYDPLANRQAFYDTSHLLPSAMLEDYVMEVPTPRIENFRYMLRSGMMGWASIMQDTTKWTPEQHTAAKTEFALYKSDLRTLIRDADLYHISPRPDGIHWDAIEYFDPSRGRGAVYAFRGSTPIEDHHSFQLKGLRANQNYRLHFQDHTSADLTVTGSQLLSEGLTVNLPVPDSSEIIHIEEIRAAGK